MNVSPINSNTTKTNCQNFKGYRSSITRDALTTALKKVQQNGQTNNMVDNWWRILESMRKTYLMNKFVNVETSLRGEDVWAIVSLCKGRKLEDFVNVEISQSITIEPQRMKNHVDSFASETRKKLTRRGLSVVA